MANVYRKSAKGLDEIQTRTHRLVPRLRSALILVDGQRSDADLARLVPDAADLLATLLQQGFVEPAPREASPATPVPRSRTAVPPDGRAVVAEERPPVAYRTLQREAVRRLTELVGPTAEPLAIRMERAADRQALDPLLLQARNLIAGMRGQRLADEYAAALAAL